MFGYCLLLQPLYCTTKMYEILINFRVYVPFTFRNRSFQVCIRIPAWHRTWEKTRLSLATKFSKEPKYLLRTDLPIFQYSVIIGWSQVRQKCYKILINFASVWCSLSIPPINILRSKYVMNSFISYSCVLNERVWMDEIFPYVICVGLLV